MFSKTPSSHNSMGARRPRLGAALSLAALSLAAPNMAQSPLAPYGMVPASQAVAPLAPSSPVRVLATGGKIVLPERTEVRVRLNQNLKSGVDKQGEKVLFVVSAAVYGPRHVLLIPAGASAYGKVTKSSRRGWIGKPGKLAFTCEYVLTADGTHVPLRSDPLERQGHNIQADVVCTGLSPFIMNGKDVTAHKGEEFTVCVNENTPLTPLSGPP